MRMKSLGARVWKTLLFGECASVTQLFPGAWDAEPVGDYHARWQPVHAAGSRRTLQSITCAEALPRAAFTVCCSMASHTCETRSS